MPKGYELDNFYDAERAMCRKLYSEQVKRLSGIINGFQFRDSRAYALILDKINKGIYDNIGGLFSQTFFGSNQTLIGANKSARAQDFMSPMELRINAIAVKRAADELESRYSLSLEYAMDLCYRAGKSVAIEAGTLAYPAGGFEEFAIKAKAPTLNVQPIIKKFNKALVCGGMPQGRILSSETSADRHKEIMETAERTVYCFNYVKNMLVAIGLSAEERKYAFACLNSGYYEINANKTGVFEISNLISVDENKKVFSAEEMNMNYRKLYYAYDALSKLGERPTYNDIYTSMVQAGAQARRMGLSKNRVYPELLRGFYEVYQIADKAEEQQRAVKAGRDQFNK